MVKMVFKRFLGLMALTIGCGHYSVIPDHIRREVEAGRLLTQKGVDFKWYDISRYSRDKYSINWTGGEAQFRDHGKAVYVWTRDPISLAYIGMTRIQDFNGDGIVDSVMIEISGKDHDMLIRIQNLEGPDCVLYETLFPKYSDLFGARETLTSAEAVISDEVGISPFQRIVDVMRYEATK